MPDEVRIPKEALTVERLALAAVVALLSWNVYTTNQLTIAQAVTTAQVQAVYEQIGNTSRNLVSRADFLVLAAEMRTETERFETWLGRLSDRVNALETKDHTNEGKL